MTSTQGQDFPDSLGYWAYDGDLRYVGQITHYEIMDDDLVRIEFYNWESGPQLVSTKAFREMNPGKWHKLTMPWDTPTPTPAPLSAQSVFIVTRDLANGSCINILAYLDKGEAEAQAQSLNADKELDENGYLCEYSVEPMDLQSPTVGASVPVAVAYTIGTALEFAYRSSLTEKDIDAALVWLEQQRASGGMG
jgi:hypothetical protein